MKTLLLVSHTPSPNTERLVNAMCERIAHTQCDNVTMLSSKALATNAETVLSADAIILFTTENLGYMSGALKDFFDRVYYPCLEIKQGLPTALIIRAGHDGTGTHRAVTTICSGLKWRFIQEPLICRGEWDEKFIEQCSELAEVVAVSLDCGII